MSGNDRVIGQGATNAINKFHWCTETTETGKLNKGKQATGFVSKTTGMVTLKVPENAESDDVYVIAGAHNIYNVETMIGGTVPVTDIMLFWQGI